MSYNLTDPNKLPITLPMTNTALIVGNTNGQCSFVEAPNNDFNLVTTKTGDFNFSTIDTSEASDQYQFLTIDPNESASLQNLNISIGDSLSGDDINSGNLSTTISLPNQTLENYSCYVEFDIEDVLFFFQMSITDQGVASSFVYALLPIAGALAARRTSQEDRIAQIEERIRALEAKVLE